MSRSRPWTGHNQTWVFRSLTGSGFTVHSRPVGGRVLLAMLHGSASFCPIAASRQDGSWPRALFWPDNSLPLLPTNLSR
jgi:hypothetical protein